VTANPGGHPEPQSLLEDALGIPLDTAFEIVYRRAYWLRRGHQSDAEDLTQDVLLKLAERAREGKLCITGRAKAFLEVTTTNLFIDQHRKRENRKNKGGEVLVAVIEDRWLSDGSNPEPDRLVIDAEDAKVLHRALIELPAPQRLVVELRLRGLSLAEVVDRLGLPKSTVASQQSAAFKQMRSMLRRSGWGNIS
jgi:RNA polymerase sigma factor (sigma-70 family)